MKLHLGALLIIMMLGFSFCNKPMYPNGTFKAKLLASFCAYHIVQIQDTDYYNQGMDWTDSQGKQYQHVFAVKNHCDFAKGNLKTGDEFTCAILNEDGDANCAVCMGFMETPPLLKNIHVVK